MTVDHSRLLRGERHERYPLPIESRREIFIRPAYRPEPKKERVRPWVAVVAVLALSAILTAAAFLEFRVWQ